MSVTEELELACGCRFLRGSVFFCDAHHEGNLIRALLDELDNEPPDCLSAPAEFYRRLANEMAVRAATAESKLDQCLRVVREYVSSELADDPSQDDPSCQLYPLIELVRKRP